MAAKCQNHEQCQRDPRCTKENKHMGRCKGVPQTEERRNAIAARAKADAASAAAARGNAAGGASRQRQAAQGRAKHAADAKGRAQTPPRRAHSAANGGRTGSGKRRNRDGEREGEDERPVVGRRIAVWWKDDSRFYEARRAIDYIDRE